MARRVSRRHEHSSWWSRLRGGLPRNVVPPVASILWALLAAFFTLAPFGLAGPVGNEVASTLRSLVGYGYPLFPLASLGASAALLLDTAAQRPSWMRVGGAAIFGAALLALLSAFLPHGGGAIGEAILSPLEEAFGSLFSAILAGGFALIGLILVFEERLHLFSTVPARLWRTLHAHLTFSRQISARALKEADEPTGEESSAPVGEAAVEEERNGGNEGAQRPSRATNQSSSPSIVARVAQQVRSRTIAAHGEKKESEEEATDLPLMPLSSHQWQLPPLSLLKQGGGQVVVGDTRSNAAIIERTLRNFGVVVAMGETEVGPTVTRYTLTPAEGVRLSRIVSLQSNLELALAASPIRIEAPIPGKPLVGIEVPNRKRAVVGLHGLLADPAFQTSRRPLLIALGRDITGGNHYADIAKMPHLLVAGATGAGKSVTIHAFIASLLYRNTPEMLRFILVDPKRVELTLYKDIPHLLTPVITDAKKAILALRWAIKEMERRYGVLEAFQVRDIHSYHTKVVFPAYEAASRRRQGAQEESMPEPMPYIVIIVDELADLMQTYPRELEASVVRLAQMSRAVGIHLILSTQRPSVNVVTGLIKANIPARIALQVSSQVDSRTILDQAGAEKLLGAGDMLYLSGDRAKPIRLQAPYISEEEVKKLAKHWQRQGSSLDEMVAIDLSQEASNGAILAASLEEEDDDALYEEAKRVVLEQGKASTSLLQRKLRIGYSRAARIMDLLEERGIIGPPDGSKPREVLPQAYEEHQPSSPAPQEGGAQSGEVKEPPVGS